MVGEFAAARSQTVEPGNDLLTEQTFTDFKLRA
jgi:hypothetical protein